MSRCLYYTYCTAESLCVYKSDIEKLDAFYMRCIRLILGINWQDRITNTEVLRRSIMVGMEALLMKIENTAKVVWPCKPNERH